MLLLACFEIQTKWRKYLIYTVWWSFDAFANLWIHWLSGDYRMLSLFYEVRITIKMMAKNIYIVYIGERCSFSFIRWSFGEYGIWMTLNAIQCQPALSLYHEFYGLSSHHHRDLHIWSWHKLDEIMRGICTTNLSTLLHIVSTVSMLSRSISFWMYLIVWMPKGKKCVILQEKFDIKQTTNWIWTNYLHKNIG